MYKDTNCNYAQFLDGIVTDDYLWCVERKAPVLLCIDTKTWSIVHTLWLDKYIQSSNMARKIFLYNEKIYITYRYGRKILCVDLFDLSIRSIQDCDTVQSMNADAVLYEGCIYSFPHNLQEGVDVFNLKEEKVYHKRIMGKNEGINIISTICQVGCFIYSIVMGTNKVVCIELSSMKCFIREVNDNVILSDLIVIEKGFSFLSENSLVFCGENFEIYEKVNLLETERYCHILYGDNEIILVPEWSTTIWKYSFREKKLVKLYNVGGCIQRTNFGSLVFGCFNKDRTLWMFPWMSNAVIEYKTNTESLEIHKVSLDLVLDISEERENVNLIVEDAGKNLKRFVGYIMDNEKDLTYDPKSETKCIYAKYIYEFLD